MHDFHHLFHLRGGDHARYSPPSEVPNVTKALPQRGYLDIGYTSSFRGPFGGGGGILVNQKGFALYGSVGVTTPGKGLSITKSEKNVEPFSTNGSVEFDYIGALDFSAPFVDKTIPLSAIEVNAGVAQKPGISVMINQNFSFHQWDDRNGYSFIKGAE